MGLAHEDQFPMNQFRVGCNNTSPLQIGIPSIGLFCKEKSPIEGKKCSKCAQRSDLHSKIEPIGSSYKRTLKTSEPTEPAIKLGRLTLQMKLSLSTLEVCWFLILTAKHWDQPVPLQGILKERTSGQIAPVAARVLSQYSLIGSGQPRVASLLAGSPDCYQVQAPSAHCTTRHWIREMRFWAKKMTSLRKQLTERMAG